MFAQWQRVSTAVIILWEINPNLPRRLHSEEVDDDRPDFVYCVARCWHYEGHKIGLTSDKMGEERIRPCNRDNVNTNLSIWRMKPVDESPRCRVSLEESLDTFPDEEDADGYTE